MTNPGQRMAKQGLIARLKNGGNILVAEGYLWEFARRGYLKLGKYVPEVVLEHPDLVTKMHEEFVHAGSDVVQAFTYCGHRQKLKTVGREDEVEKLNRTALRLAKKVADENGCLFAGGICHTFVYDKDDPEKIEESKGMFKEMIEWAVDEGVDYIAAETFSSFGEARLALQCIQDYGKGVPAVITMTAHFPDKTSDDVPFPEACRQLEEAGAAVVGLNCSRGPRTMIPLLREIKKACKGPIAALPVPFRCTDDCRTFYSLTDDETGSYVYPNDLECKKCSASDIIKFGKEALEIGVQYVGLCCGNSAAYMRELAEVYGRKPEASKYSTDMSSSFVFTSNPENLAKNQKRERLWLINKN